jgi:hypothetical protein
MKDVDPDSGMPPTEQPNVPPELIEELRDVEHLSREDLKRIREDYAVTFRDLLTVEEIRRPVLKAFARADIEEHRAIYDRLAES